MVTVKHKLEVTLREDVAVIGLCSHEHEHRICWALNRTLGVDMGRRSVDVMEQGAAYTAFDSTMDEEGGFYSLISNRNGATHLITEVPHADHFLVAYGEENIERMDDTMRRVLAAEQVLMAFAVEIEKLKKGSKLLGGT